MGKAMEAVQAAREQLKANSREAVQEVLAEFFASAKDVESIRWKQYTPYFNDGDPCVFGLHGVEAKLTEAARIAAGLEGGEGDYGSDEFHDEYTLRPHKADKWGPERAGNEVVADELKGLEKQLYGLKEVLEEAFGDHAEVTINRTGESSVESYEHD